MNLYLKLLTRELMTTGQFEKWLESRYDVLKRYRQVQNSAELKEYLELKGQVAQPDYQAHMHQMLNTSYGDTHEGKTMAKYRRMGLYPDIVIYESLLNNSNVKAWLAFSQDPERYALLQDKEKVEQDEELKKMKKLDSSLLIKDFRFRRKTRLVREFEQLKAEIHTDSFQESNRFWQNPQRWFTLPESETNQRFELLDKNADIRFYFSQKSEQMDFIDQFEPAFKDRFEWQQLKDSAWKPGFVYPSKDYVEVHSFTNEVQAYNNGKNVRTENGKLYIDTKKEKVNAPAWDPKKGMVMKDFKFTSDVINCGDALEMEEGAVIVKACCRGLNLNHGIYLRSKNHLPFISIFNYSNHRLFCGLKANEKEQLVQKKIDGLQPITDLIYTVLWDKNEIVWYVNNLEVHRVKNTMPKGEKLYLHMYSYGFPGEHTTEGNLQVDWVYAYKKVKGE